MSDMSLPVRVVALYHFTPFEDHAALRGPLLACCQAEKTGGILLLAKEGINGTIAGSDKGIDRVLAHIRSLPGCGALIVKESRAPDMPFRRMKVRLKREIVTMGLPDIDPSACVGRYVEPKDWNALISDPDTVLIDTRNDYEVAIGTFRGAIDPGTKTFRDFPSWFRAWREALEGQGRTAKVAMFCTGGIRCEKATSFAVSEGVEEVYHLKGGILSYLEQVAPDQSLWEGECFVFDRRVSVTHGLEPGHYDLCHACRAPISAEDKASPLYEPGISCPHCHESRTPSQRRRYAERERQEALAASKGEVHLGNPALSARRGD